MDIGSVTSSYRGPAPVEAVRPLPPAASGTAAADLPVTAVVPALDGSAAPTTDRDKASPTPVSGELGRRVVIDPDTQEVVFQSVDDLTQDVVRQYPDQAMLRRKAYLEKLDETRATDETATTHTLRFV
jgi:hypothetical protein